MSGGDPDPDLPQDTPVPQDISVPPGPDQPQDQPQEPPQEQVRQVPEELPDAPDDWQRLDPRMLLVHPVRETVRFLPVLLGLLVAGTASGIRGWQLLGVLVPVVVGLLRYLTTSYRVTGGRVELRRGLLERHVLSTPIDRVRTVDLTAPPVHRLLGLVTIRVGTGTASTSEDEQLDLDGLPVERARRLREELLRASPAAGAAGAGAVAEAFGPGAHLAPPPPVLTFDPAWARFAPLTSTGVVITAGLLGAGAQLVDALGGLRRLDASSWADRVAGLSVVVAGVAGVLVLALATSVLAVGGYLVANWGFTLGHRDGAWHLRRGLLTTRETSLDDARLAGVTLGEPLGLRATGGGRLAAIVTGLGEGQESSSVLVPPAPRPVVEATARAVLGAAGPVDVPLRRHGPAATRRRWTRALGPALVLSAACLALLPRSPWWALPAVLAPLAAAALAADRAGSLGHALSEGYVVSRSGSLYRRRDVLAVAAIIGWNVRATWFQRRAGLVTLVATTAGGRQSVTILDAPAADAVALALEATPDLVGPFLYDRPATGRSA
ncbi:PH domain-containing protein [Nocardioides sp. zg-579]|uniref:PH domain-containing protein n=1 Tax=Nocardioides marmotae TaxID=2663857 RepID=A0A6I3J9X4_9ACTN|nr:PH domain-containing protein [Nocardioides marmotae]MCR6031371.1 PH domain-containing protein [Gordonia jinghuaiqii]MTB95010.1 PH domain-containing protein [Nocardioides marmotae]QKE02488.1 PH domain-containing protein [Nocardioides marmotae]